MTIIGNVTPPFDIQRDAGHLTPGDIVPVLVEDADEHDLYGLPRR